MRADIRLLVLPFGSKAERWIYIDGKHQQWRKEIIHYDGEWVKNSFITLSEKPGIGVEINEEGMKKYAIPGIPFFV